MLMFLLGCYCTGAIATFMVACSIVALRGDDDMWKPFFVAAIWPPLFLIAFVRWMFR